MEHTVGPLHCTNYKCHIIIIVMFPGFPWLKWERQVGEHPPTPRTLSLLQAVDRDGHHSPRRSRRPVSIRSRSLFEFPPRQSLPDYTCHSSAFTPQHYRIELLMVCFVQGSSGLILCIPLWTLITCSFLKSPNRALFGQCGLSRHTSHQSNPTPRKNNQGVYKLLGITQNQLLGSTPRCQL